MKEGNSYAPKTADSKLGQFFTSQLQDIYWAEQHLVKTLPKMQEAATSDELKEAFDNHLEQTKQHVSRLERVFDITGEGRKTQKSKAMAGITDEGEDIIDETEEGTVTRDAGLIFAAQKVEHYEIATYGGLVHLARTLDRSDVADILEQTLREEKEADSLLTQIAKNNVNQAARHEMA